jgi:hypothetical protein
VPTGSVSHGRRPRRQSQRLRRGCAAARLYRPPTGVEKAAGVSAAYRIYLGAAHAEPYAVVQGWNDAGQ